MLLANQTLQLLAARRFSRSLRGRDDVESVLAAGDGILAELRNKLSQIIGTLGFHALLNRALMSARPAHPWLAAARAEAGGHLAGLPEAVHELGAVEVLSGFVALVSHVLILLHRLIGDDLTQWVIFQIWPDEVLEASLSGPSEKLS